MRWDRSGLGAGQRVVLAVEGDCRPWFQQGADDSDGLLEGVDQLRYGAAWSAHGDDRVDEGSGPEAELHASIAQDVEGGGAAREYRRWSKWNVGDVGKQPDVLGSARHIRKESPGVKEPCLIWMVLKIDDVDPEVV
jgi:hypothetical protein